MRIKKAAQFERLIEVGYLYRLLLQRRDRIPDFSIGSSFTNQTISTKVRLLRIVVESKISSHHVRHGCCLSKRQAHQVTIYGLVGILHQVTVGTARTGSVLDIPFKKDSFAWLLVGSGTRVRLGSSSATQRIKGSGFVGIDKNRSGNICDRN